MNKASNLFDLEYIESLKCLHLIFRNRHEFDDVMISKFTTVIRKCNTLGELYLNMAFDLEDFNVMNLVKTLPQNLKKLLIRWLELADFKVLVARCSKLEHLCIDINAYLLDEVITIIVGLSLIVGFTCYGTIGCP